MDPRPKKTDLSATFIKSLTPDPEGKTYEVMDTRVRAFGIRVQPTGTKSWIMRRRFPGLNPYQPPQNPVVRTLGYVGEFAPGEVKRREEERKFDLEKHPITPGTAMTLAEARELANNWHAAIKRGIDPTRAAEKERQDNIAAERARRVNTVKSVLESYLLDKAGRGLRSIHKMETDLTREFTAAGWMDRAITDFSPQVVKNMINAIKKDGKAPKAKATYSLVTAFFNWVVDSGDYGLEVSPCASINTKNLVGSIKEGDRTLGEHEIRAYWRAAETLPYPTGPYFQLLLLTALRRGEASPSYARGHGHRPAFAVKQAPLPSARIALCGLIRTRTLSTR